MSYSVLYSDGYLCHHGIMGQKWGLRRWQYSDGSLTPEGYVHYGVKKARNKEAKYFTKELNRRSKKGKDSTSIINKLQERGFDVDSRIKVSSHRRDASRRKAATAVTVGTTAVGTLAAGPAVGIPAGVAAGIGTMAITSRKPYTKYKVRNNETKYKRLEDDYNDWLTNSKEGAKRTKELDQIAYKKTRDAFKDSLEKDLGLPVNLDNTPELEVVPFFAKELDAAKNHEYQKDFVRSLSDKSTKQKIEDYKTEKYYDNVSKYGKLMDKMDSGKKLTSSDYDSLYKVASELGIDWSEDIPSQPSEARLIYQDMKRKKRRK